MRVCNECNASTKLVSLKMRDIGLETEDFSLDFCSACIEEKRLTCVVHGLKIAYFNSGDHEDGEDFSIRSACVWCAWDKIRGIDEKVREAHIDLLKQRNPGFCKTVSCMPCFHDPAENMTEQEKVLHVFAMIAEITKSTFEETIVDFAMNRPAGHLRQ